VCAGARATATLPGDARRRQLRLDPLPSGDEWDGVTCRRFPAESFKYIASAIIHNNGELEKVVYIIAHITAPQILDK
jgi:hypothetical protein